VLCLIGGLVWNAGWSRFQDSQGRVRFYINGDVLANHFGSVFFYNGNLAGWHYFWSKYSTRYCYSQAPSGTNFWAGFGAYGCGGGSSGSF
jgi:hypothetical protein